MLVSAFIKIDGFDISSIKLSFLNGTKSWPSFDIQRRNNSIDSSVFLEF